MGMIAALFDLYIGMPGSMGMLHSLTKRMVFKSPSLRGVQGAGSSVISTALLAYTVGWALMNGRSDQDWDEYVSKWARKWAGVGGNQLIEMMLQVAVWGGLADERGGYEKKHLEKALGPLAPAGKDIVEIVKVAPEVLKKEWKHK